MSGRLTFEWLPGGFFLQQRVELNFMGFDIAGLEVIGYDPATGKFPSTVFASMIGVPIPYEYDVQGDQVTIRTELAGGATFTGTWAEDGASMSGGWRPDPGRKVPATSPTTSAARARASASDGDRGPILTNRSSPPGFESRSIGESPDPRAEDLGLCRGDLRPMGREKEEGHEDRARIEDRTVPVVRRPGRGRRELLRLGVLRPPRPGG